MIEADATLARAALPRHADTNPSPASDDPTFAVLKRHAALWKAWGAAISRTDAAQEAFGEASAAYHSAYDQQQEIGDAACDYRDEVLITTVPRTAPGLAAYVAHVRGEKGYRDISAEEVFADIMNTIQASLRLIQSN
ncbi:hypothetical protein FHS55_002119 [Angulomicrobium tetraedrale]|uniref:Uncharacterized protein n=1 Tax=Ancylobacter tetraedralis TaxID=217068 RepID=A0A839Z9V4_9HYPH|nr:hypothetical protein [Ancylobacter tetraedralis]MBB3771520.1 hypothetical protein [Ancylobacter tetraedralis]